MIKLWNSRSWTASQRRWGIGLVLAVVAYSLIGFFLLPPIIKWQLTKQLPKTTKRSAEVREVRVNPWTLSLTIRGLTLKEPNAQLFASWEEFYANFQLSSIFRWAWTFKEIHLIDPRGTVILQKNGQFNFANMFERSAAPAKTNASTNISRVTIFLLSVTNGFVSFEDQTRHRLFRTDYWPINIVLRNLSTRPGTDTPYSFHAENDTGKTLDWAGDLTAVPFSSRGTIRLQKGEPKKYGPYLDDFTTAEITDGRVNIHGDYFVGTGTNGVDLVVTNGFVQLTNFKVTDPDVKETVFSVPDLTVQRVQFNLRDQMVAAQTLKISGTELVTRLNQDGSMNLLRLLVPPSTNGPSTKVATSSTNASRPWTINLAEFHFENGSISFEDRSRKSPFQTRLNPIDLTVKGFSTRPESDASYEFSIATEISEKVAGGGTVSINPVRSAGEVSVAGAEVKKYKPFLEQVLRGEVVSGKINLNAAYQAALGTNGAGALAALASNTIVRLMDLQLKLPGSDETVISIPEFSVEGAMANLGERSAKVTRVKTAGGSILLRRETNDTINLVGLLQPSPKPAASTNAPESTPPRVQDTNAPWAASIDEVALENYTVNFQDKKPAKPAVVKLDQIALNLKGISTKPQTPIEAAISTRLNESGSSSAKGTVTLSPMSVDLDLLSTNIDLRALEPYVDEYARLALSSGSFNLGGHAKWQSAEAGSGHLKFDGGFSIVGLAAMERAPSEDLVKWTNLVVDGIKLEIEPNSLHIETILWDGLNATLLINSNKELNVKTVFRRTNAEPAKVQTAAAEERPAQTSAPFPVTVSTFALTNAELRVKDLSIEPPFETELKQFSGAVTGLSSDANSTAEVNLAGLAGEQSPISISGRVNPFAAERHLDLTVSNRNMQLTPYTPYMEKFAGYPLNRGRLSLALHYQIEGKELKADNHVQVDQLALGSHNNSPDATKLPVKLAIALLKDSDGRILLDVPVNGKVDDPQFRVGPIILKVIVNLIIKAVASPFKLLGAAVGGGEELSFLEFQPGSAQLIEGETNKIGKLTQALNDRPGLNLEIEASVDLRRDRDALARKMVEQEIKRARLQELSAVGQSPPAADSFEVEQAEERRLLRAAVLEKFGTNLTEAIEEMKRAMTNKVASPGSTANVLEESGETRKHKWYQSVLIPFQGKNSPAAVARRQAKADAKLLKDNPELGNLNREMMERLLATKIEVPPEQFVELMKKRTDAAREELLKTSQLADDRVLLVAPKPMKEGYHGEARVNLSLN